MRNIFLISNEPWKGPIYEIEFEVTFHVRDRTGVGRLGVTVYRCRGDTITYVRNRISHSIAFLETYIFTIIRVDDDTIVNLAIGEFKK